MKLFVVDSSDTNQPINYYVKEEPISVVDEAARLLTIWEKEARAEWVDVFDMEDGRFGVSPEDFDMRFDLEDLEEYRRENP
jgi:hypothetical protein